jgi:hypothetical protein
VRHALGKRKYSFSPSLLEKKKESQQQCLLTYRIDPAFAIDQNDFQQFGRVTLGVFARIHRQYLRNQVKH